MSNEWDARPLDYYKVLQIDPSAEPEVIEAAYKKLSLKYHDDTSHRGDGKMKEINVAGGVLRDNVRRKEYDTWYRNYYGRDTASTSQPPKPVAEPNSVIVDDIVPGEKRTASFILKNEGGAVKGNCKIDPVNPQSGIRITAYKSLSSDLFPLRVEFEVAGGKWGTIATEFLRILLDGEECRVRVDVRARRFTFGAALRETGKFTVKVLHSLPMQGIRRVLVKKRRIPKWVGVTLVLVAIGYGWNMLASNFADNGTTLTRDLSQGMRGGDVSELQRHLAAAGVYSENVTGYFGDITEEAVKRYQRAHGIEPTGFVGPATRAALNASETDSSPVEKFSTSYKLSSQPTAAASSPSPAQKSSDVSASSDPTPKNPPKSTATSFVVSGSFVDRNGNPVQAEYWLMDNQDKLYGVGSAGGIVFSIPKALSNGSFKTVAVPDGTYTLYVRGESSYFGESKTFGTVVTIAGADQNLGKVVLPWSWVTGRFVDRNGSPVKAKYWLIDSNDKTHGSEYVTALSNGSFKTAAVSDGSYTLHVYVDMIVDGSYYFGETRTLKIPVTISGSDVDLHDVILPWSWITGTFVDHNGNPVETRFWLTDSSDKRYGYSLPLSNGSFKTVAVPDGTYTLDVSGDGRFKNPKDQIVVRGKDISLGQVLLEGK